MELRSRRSMRLKKYDYSQSGSYYITLCVKNRLCLFGEIRNQEMQLNDLGKTITQCWDWLQQQYKYVHVAEYIVMPDHTHAIIAINAYPGGSRTAPTDHGRSKSLGRLVGAFKTVSTKKINALRQTPGFDLWQRNYYEHVVRDETELHELRRYIRENPIKWDIDPENPASCVSCPGLGTWDLSPINI